MSKALKILELRLRAMWVSAAEVLSSSMSAKTHSRQLSSDSLPAVLTCRQSVVTHSTNTKQRTNKYMNATIPHIIEFFTHNIELTRTA